MFVKVYKIKHCRLNLLNIIKIILFLPQVFFVNREITFDRFIGIFFLLSDQ